MSFWNRIPRPIIGLSPMDGITDASFRFIAAKYGGPDVTFTEFVSVETAFHAPHSLVRDLAYSELERPVIAQIYGHTPDLFYKVAHIVCALGFDGLDVNMGCPARKVAAKGSGAALIRTPALARSIIEATVRGVADWSEGQTLRALRIDPALIENVESASRARGGEAPAPRTAVPVSVKTRIGYDEVVIEEWIRTLAEQKLAAISVHGRTLAQQYKGPADWDAIARAVAAARGSGVLILGNGDLRDPGDICRRVRETGVDGVLVGRGALGNPWLFGEKEKIKHALLRGGVVPVAAREVRLEERIAVMLEHARHYERRTADSWFAGMRKHLAWYCYGTRGAAELRAQMVRLNSSAELARCLAEYALFIASGSASSFGRSRQPVNDDPHGSLRALP